MNVVILKGMLCYKVGQKRYQINRTFWKKAKLKLSAWELFELYTNCNYVMQKAWIFQELKKRWEAQCGMVETAKLFNVLESYPEPFCNWAMDELYRREVAYHRKG